MKETFLNLDTKTNEFRFEKPLPYMTIKIANKDTFERLVEIIDRDIPADVEINKTSILDINGDGVQSCDISCPNCKNVVSFGRTVADAIALLPKYCPNCGQALVCEVQE